MWRPSNGNDGCKDDQVPCWYHKSTEIPLDGAPPVSCFEFNICQDGNKFTKSKSGLPPAPPGHICLLSSSPQECLLPCECLFVISGQCRCCPVSTFSSPTFLSLVNYLLAVLRHKRCWGVSLKCFIASCFPERPPTVHRLSSRVKCTFGPHSEIEGLWKAQNLADMRYWFRFFSCLLTSKLKGRKLSN